MCRFGPSPGAGNAKYQKVPNASLSNPRENVLRRGHDIPATSSWSPDEWSTSLHEQPPASPAWLFPSSRPGAHLYPGRLSTGLNQELGIFIRPSRGAALANLAADLPAPVLADLLGLSITTATRWTALAARDNAAYVAARIESSPAPTPISG